MDTNRGNKLVPVLVVLLIVAAFLIGSLYTKVQLYEKDGSVVGSNTNTGGNAVAPQVAPPPAPPAGPVDIDISGISVLGNKDAKVAIIEFTDYQCPFCKSFHDNAFAQAKKEYIDTGKVQYMVRDFPLFQIHPQAEKAAQAANCASDQNKYFEYGDTLFKNQQSLQITDLKKYAVDLGLNAQQFDACLDSGKHAQKVKNDVSEGDKVGVSGTPASFVGTIKGNTFTGTMISGAVPFATLKAELDKLL